MANRSIHGGKRARGKRETAMGENLFLFVAVKAAKMMHFLPPTLQLYVCKSNKMAVGGALGACPLGFQERQ